MTAAEPITPEILFAGLEDDREGAAQYLSIFIDEAQSTLDELIEALLALETGGGKKQVEQLFVAAHRMKGSAASIGLNRIAKLSHLMEDLLQTLVDEGCTPTAEITDALLSCTDGLRQSVGALQTGQRVDDRFPSLAKELLAASAACGAAGAASPVSALANPPESCGASVPAAGAAETAAPRREPPVVSAAEIGDDLRRRLGGMILEEQRDDVLVGRIVFEANLPLVGLKAQLLCSKLANVGEIRHLNPSAAALETLEDIAAIEFALTSNRSADAVRGLLQVAGVQSVAVEPLERRRTQVLATAEARTTEPGVKPAETLRVDIERLDQLMNLAGQLVICKARIAQISGQLKKAVAEKDFAAARDGVGNLFEAIHLLDRVSDGVQQGVMNMRMLPIGPLFSRFHRVIRDLTRGNGKEIRLDISGEGTELDKRMIDELGDPMIHIIRNSADHGIESPEVRIAAGKPRCGTISLCAFHRGSNIIIQVRDDGHGLDVARIRAKAVERGLVSPADAERMTPREIYQLIWLPGLSTADKVTEVSGRGVGMDIVRSKIEELNGSIDIDSELGRGTTLTVKLPLTLAILPSLMVEIDGDAFAIPLESVAEIVNVGRDEIHTVQGRPMASVRDRVVPILTLDRVFDWRQGPKNKVAEETNATSLVIIGEEGRRLGLAVHHVIGEEDVVIKSLADNYRNVAGIAGASILGDGRVSLILDPHALIEMSSRSGIAAAATLENSQ
jgi:two-component system, chemotaxis family, sensor kinase CheA